MRLRVTIKRHELPVVQILHGISNAESTTVSELVAQVNTVIPLESEDGEWGLEDYIVSVGGFECVHYTQLADVLKDDDHVEIRAAQTVDARTRRMTGRLQVSREGARLLDGLPYGSRRMRKTVRPPINIPPLKRRRLLVENDDGDENPRFAEQTLDEEDDDYSEDGDTEGDAGLSSEKREAGRISAKAPQKRKIKRVRIQELDANEVESEEAEISDGNTSESASDSDVSTSDESDSATESSSSKDATTGLRGQSLGSEDSLSGLSSSSVSETSSYASSKSGTCESSKSSDFSKDLKSIDGSTMVDDPSGLAGSVKPSPQGTIRQKIPNLQATQSKLKADQIKGRFTGLIHPSLEGQVQTPAEPVRPGQGKSRTQRRNERRKRSRAQKFLTEQARSQGMAEASEVDTTHVTDDAHLTTDEISPQPVAHNQPSSLVGHDDQEERAATEALRTELLRDVAESQAGASSESTMHTDDNAARNETEVITNLVFTKPAQEADPEMAVSKQTPVKNSVHVSPPTTARRLRPGANTIRTILAGIGGPANKKKKEEAPLAEPPKRNWQDVIKLSAIECGAKDIDLPDPPFPFQQRWHNIPGRVFGKRKSDYFKPILEKYGVTSAGQKRKRNNEEGDDDVETVSEAALDGANVKFNEDDQAAEGINYDEEVPSGDSHTLKGPSTTPSSADDDQKDVEEGFPREPIEAEQLSPLTLDECTEGSYIYFKRLEVSPEGTPEIHDFRTARIERKQDDNLTLKLARRDMPTRDEKAERRRSHFHLQHHDSPMEEVEERLLTTGFGELIEPSLINLA